MVTDVAVNVPAGLLKDKEVSASLDTFSTWDEGATVIINRMPTTAERELLAKRARAIEGAIAAISTKGSDFAEAKKLLAQFFLGYPSLLNADAPGLITAYVSDLRGIPLYALRQALDDIKHGRVTVRDVKGREMPLDKDWPPSSGRVYDIAVKISDPQWQEFTKINRVLGTVRLAQAEVSEDERKAVAARVQKMHEQFTKTVANHEPIISAYDEALLRAEAEKKRQQHEREMEYRNCGLEPRYADPEKKVIVSLPFMLAMGHKITRDASGATVLVGPNASV